MTADRLSELVAQFDSQRVAVIGDFFLDKYLEFDPSLAEVSVETGRTAHQVVGVRHSPGAAGNVVANLASLGASVIPVGFTGDDGEGYELRQDLERLGCDTGYLTVTAERHTPTYLKPCNRRVAGLEGEAERYDTKNRTPMPEHLQKSLAIAYGHLAMALSALVIVDQVDEPDCGVITGSMRAAIAKAAAEYPEKVYFVDSRRRAGLFEGVCLKPNESEALAAVGRDGPVTQDAVLDAGRELHRRAGKPVFLTRSEKGILVFDDGVWDVPAVDVEGPFDPTGAGDSATSAAVLTLASGGSPVEAALMANLSASITVKQLGVTGVARPEELAARLEMWRKQGKAICRV